AKPTSHQAAALSARDRSGSSAPAVCQARIATPAMIAAAIGVVVLVACLAFAVVVAVAAAGVRS
ncbi:hypothetical protein, partial [Microbacterium sp.]|uniref:hypothetical protein n=1 Tax=Microbacterium sp. TaxID=51671 RepID=UPI0028AC04C5